MVQLPDAAIAKVNAELLKVNFNEVSAALVQHYAGTWLRPQASSTSLMAEYDKSLLPLPLSWLLASPRSAPEAGATGLDVAENKPSHLTASSIMLYQLCLEGLGSRSNHVFQNVHHLHFLSELLLAFNDLFLEANTRWLLAALHDLYTLPLSLTHQGEQRDLSALVGFDRVTGPVADTFARELASHFASVLLCHVALPLKGAEDGAGALSGFHETQVRDPVEYGNTTGLSDNELVGLTLVREVPQHARGSILGLISVDTKKIDQPRNSPRPAYEYFALAATGKAAQRTQGCLHRICGALHNVP
eukprot:jgi/Chlat1/1449/Chrsp12S02003